MEILLLIICVALSISVYKSRHYRKALVILARHLNYNIRLVRLYFAAIEESKGKAALKDTTTSIINNKDVKHGLEPHVRGLYLYIKQLDKVRAQRLKDKIEKVGYCVKGWDL